MTSDVARRYLCPGTNCSEVTLDEGQLCEACWYFRHHIHGGLAALWPMAHDYLRPAPTRLGGRVSGGAGPSSRPPLNSLVLDTIESTLAVVVSWASLVRTRAGLSTLPGLGTARPFWMFAHAIPSLRANDHLLIGREAVDYYGDLYRVYRLLVRLVHQEMRETERIDVICPACSRFTVVSRDYGDCVACLTCGSSWGQAAWHAQLAGK